MGKWKKNKQEQNYQWGWRGEAEKSNHRCKEGKKIRKKKMKSGRRQLSPPWSASREVGPLCTRLCRPQLSPAPPSTLPDSSPSLSLSLFQSGFFLSLWNRIESPGLEPSTSILNGFSRPDCRIVLVGTCEDQRWLLYISESLWDCDRVFILLFINLRVRDFCQLVHFHFHFPVYYFVLIVKFIFW